MGKTLKQATVRPKNIGAAVPAPANPGGANVPPVPQTIPRNLSSLAIATHGPAPAIFTTQSDSISQWNRPGTSQQRFPPLPSKSNPGINAQASSVASAANVGLAALATAASVGVAALQKQGFQGAWSSIVTYSNGAIVDFDGVLYVAIQAIQNQNLNQEPDTSPAFWQVTGQVSFEGAWSSTVTYNEGALVDYSGQIYISVQASNLNNTPSSSPLWWTATGSPNSSLFLGPWSSATAYVIGNQVIYSGTAGSAYYIALANSTNKQPDTNPSDWQQIGSPNSYVFLGAYNGATAYVPGNQVSYIGSYWINISASTGNAPGVGSSFWEQIGQAAILLQNYSASINYTLGMEVVFNGDIYKCLQANGPATSVETPPNSTYWYLEGSANSATQGKNALFNPGFESNLGGYPTDTASLTSLTTPGQYVVDGWELSELDNTTYQGVYLSNFTGSQHGGNQSLTTRLVQLGASIPSTNIFYGARTLSAPIPVAAGDTFVLSGWLQVAFGGGITLPSGVEVLARLAYFVYDQNGNKLAEQFPFVDVSAAQGYTQVSVQQTIAATYGGSSTPPSYIRVQCSGFVLNDSGSTWSPSSGQYIDANFDDLSVVFSTDPSSGEILALGNLPSTLSTGFSAVATTSQIAMSWDGFAVYNQDGSITLPANGSETVTGLTAGTNYFAYPYLRLSDNSVQFIGNSDISSPNFTGIGFNGTNQEMTSTTSASISSPNFTVECWMKVGSGSTTTGGMSDCTTQTGAVSAANSVFSLNWNGSGQIVATFRDTTNTSFTLTSFQHADAEWHHVVVQMFGSSSWQLWIDGAPEATANLSTNPRVLSCFWRIGRSSANNFYAGDIGEIAIYNYALTQAQIFAHYTAGASISQSHLEAVIAGDTPLYWWKFTQSSGTSVVDSSATGTNTGTLVNSPSLSQTSAVYSALGSPAILFPARNLLASQAQADFSKVALVQGGWGLATPGTGSTGSVLGGSSGGTGAGCFSGETLVTTAQGNVRIDEIQAGDFVISHGGVARKVLAVHRHEATTRTMIDTGRGLVTPNHIVADGGEWTSAGVLFKDKPKVKFEGEVFNLSVEASDFDGQSFLLSSGLLCHNIKIS